MKSADLSQHSDNRTYYITGDRVVAVYVQATSMTQDALFLAGNPNNQICGHHFNGQRWVVDRSKLKEFTPQAMDDLFLDLYSIVDEHHPVSKIIEMYKLIGALPDARDDWSNDGPI